MLVALKGLNQGILSYFGQVDILIAQINITWIPHAQWQGRAWRVRFLFVSSR